MEEHDENLWQEVTHMEPRPETTGGVTETTSRLPVPGGWLYRCIWTIRTNVEIHASNVAIAFVPDILQEQG